MKVEFNQVWSFLLICVYYRVKPTQVMVKHPPKEISHVKKIASYVMYRNGATGRQVGSIIGLDSHTIRDHVNEISVKMGKNERLKSEIEQLLRLIKS